MGFKNLKILNSNILSISFNYPMKWLSTVNYCPQSTMNCRNKSTPSIEEHGDFIQTIFKLVFQAVFTDTKRSQPVTRWRTPEHLLEILPLQVSKSAASNDELIALLENVIKYSSKVGHPHFINQLFSSVDPYGLAGQLIADALNPSVYTYEVAPVFTLMESEVLSAMLGMVGFQSGEGMFCPGGSLANGFAINLARHHFNPNIKKNGTSGFNYVIFASEDAHYSVHKMASFLGLGEKSVVSVKVDIFGKMNTQELQLDIERAKSFGLVPFMIFATAGTTVLGAFDPIADLAAIAGKYQLWLHVDAAWGGGVLFSDKHRGLLDGIQLADSVTWNPHKLLAVPQQCSTLLVRHKGLLFDCHSRSADYLFQKDKFYDTSYDVGDRYLQCGRRADVLKFWLMWKAKGSEGFGQHVDHIMKISKYLVDEMKQRPNFKLLSEPHFVNVCFWYIPDKLKSFSSHPDYLQMLHKIAPKMKEAMMRRGSMMINYQPLRNWPNFFRFVTQNSAMTKQDILFVLNEIERIGSQVI